MEVHEFVQEHIDARILAQQQGADAPAVRAVEYKGHKVAELRVLLVARGLSTAGKKGELLARLQKADADARAAGPPGAASAAGAIALRV